MGLFDKLREKMEHHRLEKRYARRGKRTTFCANAQYIDGEYVYDQYTPPVASNHSSSSFGSGSGSGRGSGSGSTRNNHNYVSSNSNSNTYNSNTYNYPGGKKKELRMSRMFTL
jgi:hypothetical protein